MTQIQIRTDERLVFVGATGSGKTVLARYFLQYANRVFVIDPKHTFRLPKFQIRKSLPFLDDNFQIIYRPDDGDDYRLAATVRKLQRSGDCMIYIDELSTLAEEFPLTTARLGDVVRTGRELHVSVWSALQRPRGVPRIFFTESEKIFLFNLRSGDDRRYMTEFVGPQVLDQVERFQFWYGNAYDRDPVKLKLSLPNSLDLTKGSIMKV